MNWPVPAARCTEFCEVWETDGQRSSFRDFSALGPIPRDVDFTEKWINGGRIGGREGDKRIGMIGLFPFFNAGILENRSLAGRGRRGGNLYLACRKATFASLKRG